MKDLKIYFILLFCFTTSVFAQQYGNNGYGNNGYGRGGSGYNGINQNSNSEQPRNEEKSPEEIVDVLMTKLTPTLNLDALQEVAIKQMLIDDAKSRGIVIKKETDKDAQFKEIQALNNKVDLGILSLLNSEQKEKYKVFKENKGNSKNEKKSKKKNKKETD